jgi:hypothetical protein
LIIGGQKNQFWAKKKFQKIVLTFGLGFQFGGFFILQFSFLGQALETCCGLMSNPS